MPSGYTAGIIDGSIKTFPEFAKLCARAMGATIHMRDDSLSEPYTPRIENDYYSGNISELQKKLQQIEALTDEQLIAQETARLILSRENALSAIAGKNKNADRLNAILEKAREFVPPTPDHNGVKEFMIQQITDTIKWDADTDYYDKLIISIDESLASIDATKLRSERIEQINTDIAYYEAEHAKEIKRVEEANNWVTDYFAAIETQFP